MAQVGAAPSGRVYYGIRAVIGPHGQERAVDQYMTTDEAFMDFYKWDDKQRRDFIAQGVLAGQLPKGADITQASAWWQKLVNEAANFATAGVNKISPMDIAAGAVDAAGQQFGMPKTVTTTRTNTNISDPMTAKAMTTGAFQQLLGRDPAPGELGQFAAALQAAEQAAPSTSTTTSTYSPEGYLTNENVSTAGGITAQGEQQLLADKVKATSEYGVQQAATTFADATHRAIWGQPG